MTARMARERLGVGPGADGHALRAAFREAAKRCHPDRGGDPLAFREVMEAYRVLREEPLEPVAWGLAPIPPTAPVRLVIEISPDAAVLGGEAVVDAPGGRRLKIQLPPGLRPGDRVRAGQDAFEVTIRGDAAIVRGDDLWITVKVDPAVLTDGGRLSVATPRGERTVWVSRKAAARALVRLPGEGLPERDSRRQGDLFVRLAAGAARAESPARVLLRQFAAAWAA